MSTKESFVAVCEDGVELKGILFIPETPKAVVQINGGTAINKEFYAPFAQYLCEQGFISCIWDYRGSENTSSKEMADCDFYYRDYGHKDMPAIHKYLQDRFPDFPSIIFGHSAGGQQIGFAEDLNGYKGMVGFAVSTGYVHHMPLYYKLTSSFFFFIYTPLNLLLFGYLKAKKFGIMEDLPKNVIKEWRAWCMKPTYFFDQVFYGKTVKIGHYSDLPFPVHIFWADDDPISNKRSVPGFWNNVKSNHGISFDCIDVKKSGLKSVGHFGFFRRKMKDSLWPKALTKIREMLDR